MKKILITGASGFLGRYLLNFAPGNVRLLAQYFRHPLNAPSNSIQLLQLDLTTPALDELEQFQPEVIIHTAAQSSIDSCELSPETAHAINFEVTKKLADFARKSHARFIFTSSDTVFDGKKGYYAEADAPNPLNVYADTKVKAEQHILKDPQNSVIIRPALFYGRALNGNPSFTEAMLNNLKAGKQIYLFTDQYRTPLPVGQLAQAIWELVDSDFSGVLHIGGSERTSRYDMGKILCKQFDLSCDLIIPVPSHQSSQVAARPRDCSLNISLASSLLKTKLVDCSYGMKLAFR